MRVDDIMRKTLRQYAANNDWNCNGWDKIQTDRYSEEFVMAEYPRGSPGYMKWMLYYQLACEQNLTQGFIL